MKINPKLALLLGLMVGGLGAGIAKGANPAIALVPVPAIALGYAIAASRKNRSIEACQTETKRARDEIERLERGRKWDGEEIVKLVKSLEEHRAGLNKAADTVLAASQIRQTLENELSTIREEKATLQAQLDGARALIEEWESEWEERLATESEKLYQQRKAREIVKIQDECDSIMGEAMSCLDEMDELLHLGKALNEDKSEAASNMTARFLAIADSLKKSSSEEIAAYVEQIELLNVKIARLQRENEGEILEPRYIEPAYDINARIANDIARCYWEESGVALAVVGFDESKSGDVAVGMSYSAIVAPKRLLSQLNPQTETVRSRLGLAHLSKLSKPGHLKVFELRFRREPKAKEDEIKRLFTPLESLSLKIIDELDSKPTIRIMGATGDGKGVCARALVNAICREVEGWAIRLHDPQDGSREDYWGIEKVSRSGKEMKQALKAISRQMEARELGKEADSPTTLDILDEIDTQLEKEDKGAFLNLISRIRHHNMKLMLIGQNPKVSRAGFQWSDMAQMTAMYMGNSAIDAIENHPSIKRTKGRLPEQYDAIREWIERENQRLPAARKYYWGLCYLASQKEPMWFLLPAGEDIIINPVNNSVLFEFTPPKIILADRADRDNSNFAKNTIVKERQEPETPATQWRQGSKATGAETQAQKGFLPLSADSSSQPHVGGERQKRQTVINVCNYSVFQLGEVQ